MLADLCSRIRWFLCCKRAARAPEHTPEDVDNRHGELASGYPEVLSENEVKWQTVTRLIRKRRRWDNIEFRDPWRSSAEQEQFLVNRFGSLRNRFGPS